MGSWKEAYHSEFEINAPIDMKEFNVISYSKVQNAKRVSCVFKLEFTNGSLHQLDSRKLILIKSELYQRDLCLINLCLGHVS